MPYYPLSQIITDLYTNGREFLTVTTKKEYKGPYFETSTGKFYTGKLPTNNSIEIVKGNFQVYPSRPIENTNNPIFTNNDSISLLNDVLTVSTSNPLNPKFYPTEFGTQEYTESNSFTPRIIPPSYYPILTQEQKDKGQFTRYFTKRTNELRYIEINKKTYDALESKDNNIAWDLYEPASLIWRIKGNKQEIYKLNKAATSSVEQQFRWPGFPKYFKDKFTQFYLED